MLRCDPPDGVKEEAVDGKGRGLLRGLALLGLSAACSSSSPTQGVVGAACYPNETCNAGLACVHGACVAADGGVAAPDASAYPAGCVTYATAAQALAAHVVSCPAVVVNVGPSFLASCAATCADTTDQEKLADVASCYNAWGACTPDSNYAEDIAACTDGVVFGAGCVAQGSVTATP